MKPRTETEEEYGMCDCCSRMGRVDVTYRVYTVKDDYNTREEWESISSICKKCGEL